MSSKRICAVAATALWSAGLEVACLSDIAVPGCPRSMRQTSRRIQRTANCSGALLAVSERRKRASERSVRCAAWRLGYIAVTWPSDIEGLCAEVAYISYKLLDFGEMWVWRYSGIHSLSCSSEIRLDRCCVVLQYQSNDSPPPSLMLIYVAV